MKKGFLLEEMNAGIFFYSHVQTSLERLFWAGNQGNHQNCEKKMISCMKHKIVFIGKKTLQGIKDLAFVCL